MTESDYSLARILKHYHKPAYREITDYDKVVTLGVPVTSDGVTFKAYPCPGQTIYLKDDGYAVTYRRQKVDVENNKYYYNFTDEDNPEDEDIAYEYVTEYEWKNTSLPWLDP